MRHPRLLAAVALALGVTVPAALPSPASAGAGSLATQTHQAHQAKADDVRLLDVEIVDEHGRTRNFAADVIGNRLVAINFIFTTCPSICPIQSAIFASLQTELGERLGRDVFLVSVSIDPKTDVPERLQAYGQRYHAQPGWTWVTGDKKNVDQILVALGAYSSAVEEHAAMILVGDASSGVWTRFYGFPKPSALMERIDELAAARGDRADEALVRRGATGGRTGGEERP